MGIELRLRDLKFSEWGSFEPTADEWVVRETDDAVYEKLLGIVYTITQMQEHLRSLVLYHTGGSSGLLKRRRYTGHVRDTYGTRKGHVQDTYGTFPISDFRFK